MDTLEVTHRTCNVCQVYKPIEDFRFIRDRGREYRQLKCRDCYNADSRNRYANNDRRRARHIGVMMNQRARRLGASEFSADHIMEIILEAKECYYCGVPNDGQEPFAVDHRQPLSKGGTNELDNLAVACVRCNAAKRDSTEQEYKNWIQGVRDRK